MGDSELENLAAESGMIPVIGSNQTRAHSKHKNIKQRTQKETKKE